MPAATATGVDAGRRAYRHSRVIFFVELTFASAGDGLFWSGSKIIWRACAPILAKKIA
jgi:hypothetical protein